MNTSQALNRYSTRADAMHGARNVIACVDESEQAAKIVPHAIAVASALGLPITLLRVLEPQSGNFHSDPIEWNLRRHDARNALKRLAAARIRDAGPIDAELIDGHAADQICRWTREQAADLVVVGTHGECGSGISDLGSTARGVLAHSDGSVLLVPARAPEERTVQYRRILVPLDGSPWAESAMPLAQRLARAVGADLLLAHIVPVPELTQIGPLEAEDLKLRDRVVERNERVAQAYIARVRSQAIENGLRVRAMTVHGADVRSSLAQLVDAEGVDLVVLSAHGHGGGRLPDVPYGSVAAYLMTHSATPMLIVRSGAAPDTLHASTPHEIAFGAGTAK